MTGDVDGRAPNGGWQALTRGPNRPGVSVVLPTHRGAARIPGPLAALAAQELAPDMFEVVVVVNGAEDGLDEVLRGAVRDHPDLPLRVLHSDRAGAPAAYALGVAAATREYLTFVDDDDLVSPRYLSGLLAHAGPWTVVAAALGDLVEGGDGTPDWDNYIQRALDAVEGEAPIDAVPQVLAYNAGKLVPTRLARRVPFDVALASGQDLPFWTELVCRFALSVTVLPRAAGVHYYRTVRPTSLSRSTGAAQFADDRIAVLAQLSRLRREHPRYASVIRRTMISQMHFLGQHLDAHPEERAPRLRRLLAIGDADMPFESITRNRATDLALLFAFPPFRDESAAVAARRVRARGRIVDVVTMDLAGTRPVDPGSALAVAGLVDHRWVLRAGVVRRPTWNSARAFLGQGLRRLEQQLAERGPYASAYSAGDWPASHLLAAVARARGIAGTWTAELTGPLAVRPGGGPRMASVLEDGELGLLREVIEGAGLPAPGREGTLFDWAERAIAARADQVLVDSERLREALVDGTPGGSVRDALRARLRVSPAPALPDVLYGVREPGLASEPGCVHLGTFPGQPSPPVDCVLAALAELAEEQRRRLRLHVACDDPVGLAARVAALGLGSVVEPRAAVDQLSALARAATLDVLLVADPATAGPADPRLPPDLVDCLGAGRPVWALARPGSALSERTDLAWRTGADDVAAAVAVLAQLTAGSADPAATPSRPAPTVGPSPLAGERGA